MDEPSGWYALALCADIEASTSAGTRLFGHELVVWRDAAGAVHVWEDRCPHRGMRLSFGFVRGDHIACLYHGWRYDTTGQCRYIPAHPDLEVGSMIRTRTFPIREQAGLIWVFWGGEADVSDPEADIAPLPVAPLRSLYLDAPAARLSAVLGPAGPHGLAPLDLGGTSVLVAVQPLAEDASAAHIVVPAAPPAGPEADLPRLAAACCALRRSLEGATP